jgi:hypothetical protein
MTMPFEFIGSLEHEALAGDFILEVPAGIQSKGELLEALARAGQFPNYFGRNWDALLDCLRDFNWIHEKQIVIKHSDMPLRAHPTDCRTYLEILREAANDWTRTASRPSAAETSTFPDHELRVLFPAFERSAVSDVLSS